MNTTPDAVVVGSGPNGLAAAITLAQSGCSVLMLEACDSVGGGMRSAELTLPGFTHDVCSAIHPLARASPFLRSLPLAAYGLEWINPPAALAHPLFDSSAALLL
ncbi:MAG TPA: NAD(P)-binding protein, partial [Thermodesulfobacteriota bacterium]|nr:NAD(P)-binding protein [Thermodesulfobacteriota bacterium]